MSLAALAPLARGADWISAKRSSPGLHASSIALEDRVGRLRANTPTFASRPLDVPHPKPLAEKLYDAQAQYKIWVASVAMHMDATWRKKLFRQLDSLLDHDEWDAADLPPTLASFSTFIRLVLHIRPERAPGLGSSGNGQIIATWTVGANRLTVECRANDVIHWVVNREVDGAVERASGITSSGRLLAVLAPYAPEIWFKLG